LEAFYESLQTSFGLSEIDFSTKSKKKTKVGGWQSEDSRRVDTMI